MSIKLSSACYIMRSIKLSSACYVMRSIKLSSACYIMRSIKLSSACYIMRSIKPIMPIDTLRTVYYSHFNAIITYGLPFWGNSPHSTKIFKIQKRMVRIMMVYRNRVSCRSLFKKLETLPLTSQYILLLRFFVIKNKHLFILNTENHTKSKRQLNNLYHPITNLTVYQRRVHYMGIRIFNSLPPCIKDIK
jgi:hypothetical protein